VGRKKENHCLRNLDFHIPSLYYGRATRLSFNPPVTPRILLVLETHQGMSNVVHLLDYGAGNVRSIRCVAPHFIR